jgi:hypothetical protein
MRQILICGDSFGTTDSDFPGLHFSEKIADLVPDVDIINMSMPGASNSLIELQLNQIILQYNLSGVIVLFTEPTRTEFAVDHSEFWKQRTQDEIPSDWKLIHYNNRKQFLPSPMCATAHSWSNIPKSDGIFALNKTYHDMIRYSNMDLVLIKNYFTMISVLTKIKSYGIPFCFDIGGMGNQKNNHNHSVYRALVDNILPKNNLPNDLHRFMQYKTNINLWEYAQYQSGPHVQDSLATLQFAQECIDRLELNGQNI